MKVFAVSKLILRYSLSTQVTMRQEHLRVVRQLPVGLDADGDLVALRPGQGLRRDGT